MPKLFSTYHTCVTGTIDGYGHVVRFDAEGHSVDENGQEMELAEHVARFFSDGSTTIAYVPDAPDRAPLGEQTGEPQGEQTAKE